MTKIQMYDFLFLDERDSPNLTELQYKTKKEITQIINKRYFGLLGVTLAGINYPKLNMQGRRLQEGIFGPERYFPFHYNEMLNASGRFAFLGKPNKRTSLVGKMDYFLKSTDFKVIGSFIHKPKLALTHGIYSGNKLTGITKIKPNLTPKTTPSNINLYDIALKFILKDYYDYLKTRHRKGLIIAEARGEKEDTAILDTFFKYQRMGTGSLSGKEIRENIIDLLIVKKVQNHIGLQLADILLYPFYDYFVPDHSVRNDHLVKKERFNGKIINMKLFP